MSTAFKFESKVKEVKSELRSAVIEWLVDASNYILDESNKEVPIDEGTLANSGNTQIDESTLTASIGYDTPYAVRQHEDLSISHINDRGAKFLENAFKNNVGVLQDLLKDKVSG